MQNKSLKEIQIEMKQRFNILNVFEKLGKVDDFQEILESHKIDF